MSTLNAAQLSALLTLLVNSGDMTPYAASLIRRTFGIKESAS